MRSSRTKEPIGGPQDPWAARRLGPGLRGGRARQATLEGCRRELREALSDWMALRLRLGLPIPVLAGIDLNQMLPQPT